MRNIILTTVSLLLIAATVTTAQTSSQEPEPPIFAVHAEIMAETAPNIKEGTMSVQVFYSNAEFVLHYSGSVYAEISGSDGHLYPAKVFMLEPNVWVAELEGGDYIKVHSVTGNANAYLDGQYRTFIRH